MTAHPAPPLAADRRTHVRPPRHYNPLPKFGLRVQLSPMAQAILALLRGAPDGIERERIAPLLYMADVYAREYLGRPITDVAWTREMLNDR